MILAWTNKVAPTLLTQGGDIKPSSDIIEGKMSTSMDWYDEQEDDPVGHNVEHVEKGGKYSAKNRLTLKVMQPDL